MLRITEISEGDKTVTLALRLGLDLGGNHGICKYKWNWNEGLSYQFRYMGHRRIVVGKDWRTYF